MPNKFWRSMFALPKVKAEPRPKQPRVCRVYVVQKSGEVSEIVTFANTPTEKQIKEIFKTRGVDILNITYKNNRTKILFRTPKIEREYTERILKLMQ